MMRSWGLLVLFIAWSVSPALGQSVGARKGAKLDAQIVDASGVPIEGVGMVTGLLGELATEAALTTPLARTNQWGWIDCVVPPDPKARKGFDIRMFALFAKPGYSTVRVVRPLPIHATSWGADFSLGLRHHLGRIVMHPAGTLSGMVRGVNGRPLSGARIVAMEFLKAGSLKNYMAQGLSKEVYTSSGLSDEKGRFDIRGVSVDGVWLSVTAPGHYRRILRFVTADLAVDIALEPSGYMSGKVVNSEGHPLDAYLYPNAEGGVYDNGLEKGSLRTNADGSFKVTILERGRYSIRATLATMPGQAYQTALSEIYSGPKNGIVIELGGGGEARPPIAVKVVEKGSGDPIPGAGAVVVWQDPRHLNAVSLESSFLDGARKSVDGDFKLPAPIASQSQTGVVFVKAKGYSPQIAQGIAYDPEEPPSITVEMVAGGVAEGVVVDEAGKAIGGANVRIRRGDGSEAGSPFVVFGGRFSGRNQTSNPQDIVRTNAKGRFRIEDLADGHYEVDASVAGRPNSKVQQLEISATDRRQDLRLVIFSGVTLRGRVFMGLTADGKKLSPNFSGQKFRVRVVSQIPAKSTSFFGGMGWNGQGPFIPDFMEINSADRARDDRGIRTISDIGKDGEFEFFGLDAGRYRLALVAPPLGKRGRSLDTTIEPLRIRRKSVQRDFDISGDIGGVIRGSVAMPAAKIAMGRICVLSQLLTDSWISGRRLNFNASWLRCMVSEDGSFAFHARRGKHLIWLIDAVDGVVLYRHKEVVEVQASKDSKLALEVPLAMVRIRLRPENPELGFIGSQLDWIVTHPGVLEDQNFYRYNRGSGLAIEGRDEFLVSVPPAKVQFAVRSYLYAVDVKGGHGSQSVGEGVIEPVLGRLNTLIIKVPPPPDVSEAIGK